MNKISAPALLLDKNNELKLSEPKPKTTGPPLNVINPPSENPLKPPNRRLPRHIYPPTAKDYIFEVPTRGYPDNYHYYGNLIRREDDKIVKLFGRQIYPGSNQYEYYGITSDPTGGSSVKIPIKVKGDKELYDKDEIDIEFLDSSVGKFILFMNDFDRPRYNPFVIN